MAAEMRATTMRLKWQRHTSSLPWVSSAVFAMVALVAFVLLVVLWPQWLAAYVFDSRVYFHHIIDYEDMRTLSRDYVAFVRQEPEPVDDLTSVYVFSVTNANAVVERGVRPAVQEIGPFAYRKYLYRYDVQFSSDDSRVLTYKQWHRYELVTDSAVCEEMYRSLGDRDCVGTKCECLDDSQQVVVVNPQYARLLHAESAQTVLALFTEDLFVSVHSWFTNDFVTALQQHMTHLAVQSIYEFRRDFSVFDLFETAFQNLTAAAHSPVHLFIDLGATVPGHCGLDKYGVMDCPWSAAEEMAAVEADAAAEGVAVDTNELAALLLDASLNVSAVNLEAGAGRWMACLFAKGSFRKGVIDTDADVSAAVASLIDDLTRLSPNSERRGVELFVSTFAGFIAGWFDQNAARQVLYDSWATADSRSLPCSLKYSCIWDARRTFRHGGTIKSATFAQLFDTTKAVNTNLLSIYYQEYMPLWFDARGQCATSVSGIADTLPAALFVAETGSTAQNFSASAPAVRLKYQQLVCDFGAFLYDDLVLDVDFFRPYVVDFFNMRISGFTFAPDHLEDLGYAQWTDGSITLALLNVPSVYNIKRQGMWDIVPTKFGTTLLDYYAWVVTAGYPSMKPTVSEGKELLIALAGMSDASRAFRRHVIWSSSTFYGDGTKFINGVGAIGDVTFIVENNVADFNCTGVYEHLCELVDTSFMSSAAECKAIADQYTTCNIASATAWWIQNCEKFAVTSQEPNFGIQCTPTQVRGQAHPYSRKRGNVLYTMMYTWALDMFFKRDDMWCTSPLDCQFDKGGLFIQTSVRNLLFDGFVDQSVLYYYNVKHRHQQLQFECEGDTTSACDNGLTIRFPNGSTALWTRNGVDRNNFHSFTIEVALNSTSWNSSSTTTTNSVVNPVMALFPGKTFNDTAFQQEQDCQHRVLGGAAAPFPSCRNYVFTGRKGRDDMFRLIAFKGNTTIFARSRVLQVEGYHSILENYQAFGWEGFYELPFSYHFRRDGLRKFGLSRIVTWTPQWLMSTHMSSADSEMLKKVVRRPTKSLSKSSSPEQMILQEYVEARDGWDLAQNHLPPLDSYGMSYTIPIGMASVEDWAGMPAIISTPHQWGNQRWGGLEHSEVTGYVPDLVSHRSYADVDWTSGRVVQGTHRKQINIRVERSPLFPNLVSSQQRCNPPTKAFLGGSGYGCFMYIPLLWIDEQKFVSEEEFKSYYDHFYQRPVQTGTILLAGVAISIICLALSCGCYAYHFVKQRRVQHRVFID